MNFVGEVKIKVMHFKNMARKNKKYKNPLNSKLRKKMKILKGFFLTLSIAQVKAGEIGLRGNSDLKAFPSPKKRNFLKKNSRKLTSLASCNSFFPDLQREIRSRQSLQKTRSRKISWVERKRRRRKQSWNNEGKSLDSGIFSYQRYIISSSSIMIHWRKMLKELNGGVTLLNQRKMSEAKTHQWSMISWKTDDSCEGGQIFWW